MRHNGYLPSTFQISPPSLRKQTANFIQMYGAATLTYCLYGLTTLSFHQETIEILSQEPYTRRLVSLMARAGVLTIMDCHQIIICSNYRGAFRLSSISV